MNREPEDLPEWIPHKQLPGMQGEWVFTWTKNGQSATPCLGICGLFYCITASGAGKGSEILPRTRRCNGVLNSHGSFCPDSAHSCSFRVEPPTMRSSRMGRGERGPIPEPESLPEAELTTEGKGGWRVWYVQPPTFSRRGLFPNRLFL